jgi:hypothetical protein
LAKFQNGISIACADTYFRNLFFLNRTGSIKNRMAKLDEISDPSRLLKNPSGTKAAFPRPQVYSFYIEDLGNAGDTARRGNLTAYLAFFVRIISFDLGRLIFSR